MNQNEKNIVLIGFMGTGKSSVGKLLAKKLNFQFIDTDEMIESKTNTSINDIFELHGETYFRELEKVVIDELKTSKNTVISTGGGVVLDNENVNKLASIGTIICLKSSPQVIFERTSLFKNRPLLSGNDALENANNTLENANNILEVIVEKLETRKHLYNGELNLDTTFLSIEEAADRIISYVSSQTDLYTLNVATLSSEYEIVIGGKILDIFPQIIMPIINSSHVTNQVTSQVPVQIPVQVPGQVLLITSENIAPLWGEKILKILLVNEINASMIALPDGEENKTFESAMRIYGAALDKKLNRTSTIIAVGGGVIGDIAGFAASTYMRGIKLVQFPTTLLAQVDSGIGGKTGLNHPSGKNMIGTFYQPNLVFTDTSILTTLPKQEFINGIAEVIKYGMILDNVLFEFLEKNVEGILRFEQPLLNHIVKKCCHIKKTIVEKDEKESGIRTLLNYGHTIGHGIETATDYTKYRHGEAVSIGMVFAGSIALNRGLLSEADFLRQKSILEAFGLPTKLENVDIERILFAITADKKNLYGKIRMVLPHSIGSAGIYDDIKMNELSCVLKSSLSLD